MPISKHITCATFAAVLAAILPMAPARGTSHAAKRDGVHDFDFDVGVWKTHIIRRLHPLTKSNETVELTGTVTVRKLWTGRGQLEEIEADGPKGHWEGMTVFLYDPQARQWSMNFANSSEGKLNAPMIGSFNNGRAELIEQDSLGGRSILVRAVWSNILPTSHTYQEFYSANGGRTWSLSFTATKTSELQRSSGRGQARKSTRRTATGAWAS